MSLPNLRTVLGDDEADRLLREVCGAFCRRFPGVPDGATIAAAQQLDDLCDAIGLREPDDDA